MAVEDDGVLEQILHGLKTLAAEHLPLDADDDERLSTVQYTHGPIHQPQVCPLTVGAQVSTK